LQTQEGGGNTAAVNPLLPGVRIYAVIGFCDIHHFEEINQLLTSDVLIFVNTIAEIVHSRVHYWGGQCNKNLGNAFVIIWRIGDELDVQLQTQGTEKGARGSVKSLSISGGMPAVVGVASTANKNAKSKVVDLRRVPGVDKLADHALVGYLKIIAEINRNDKILDYRHEPRLTQNGKKHFHVGMGFGLHAGWAIEGAVGSIHKVDATYLSPHVNMAARLETSSRQYGVPILVSQNAFELFSVETQKMCRRVDVVTVKGSEVPIDIYTYDCLESQQFPRTKIQGQLHENEVVLERSPEEEEALERRAERFRKMGFETKDIPPYEEDDSEDEPDDNVYTGALGKYSPAAIVFSRNTMESQEIFERDTDLCILRNHANDEAFQSTFKSGIEAYLDGNWALGKTHLEKANAMMKTLAPALGGDGPCATLLEYMQEFGPEAPSWWKGYRPLTAK
jgi:class 3 adenylate cyclase